MNEESGMPILDRYRNPTMGKSLTLLSRPLTVKQEQADIKLLSKQYLESVKFFRKYSNPVEPFSAHGVPGEISGWPPARRLGAMAGISVRGNSQIGDELGRELELGLDVARVSPRSLAATICDYELVFGRTVEQGRRAGFENCVNNASCDLLLRASDGLPVVGEVKSVTDRDALSALIQSLTYASFLASEFQRARLSGLYPKRNFAGFSDDNRIDIFLLIQLNPRSEPRRELLRRSARYSAALLSIPKIRNHIRRIACFDVDFKSLRELDRGATVPADLHFALEGSRG